MDIRGHCLECDLDCERSRFKIEYCADVCPRCGSDDVDIYCAELINKNWNEQIEEA